MFAPYRGENDMKYIAAIALALAPCSAIAAPVYLKCQLDQDVGKATPWDVTLNEETGTVSFSFPDIRHALTARGIFTADTVTSNGFTFDRTNFGFQRDLSDIQAPGRKPIIDRGRCAIAQTKRAF